MKTILHVEGMSCAHCVRHVTDALTELEGVTAVTVSLETNSAEVEHEASVTVDAMKEAVVEAGYEVK